MNRQHVLPASCLLLTMSVWAGAAASAQIVPAGPRFSISDDSEHFFESPAVAVDGTGNSAVVWGFIEQGTDPEPMQEARIFGRLYGPDGEPLSPPQAVDGGPVEFQFYPDVAAVADGRFLVVWSRWAAAYDVFGQLVAAGGPEGPRFRINDRTAFWQIYPAVAADRHGEAFVVWAWDDVGDQGPRPKNVGGRRWLPDGTPAAGEVQVNRRAVNPVASRFEPTVAVARSPDGEALVVWLSEEGRIVARPYDHLGRPQGPEAYVDPSDGRVNATPAVAAGADGNFVVLWASQESYQRPAEIMARGFQGGRAVGPVHKVGAAPFRFGVRPAVTSDAEGRFVAAWTVTSAQFPSPRVALRQLAPDGRPKGAIRIVSRGGGPAVAASPDGDVLVVWNGASPNGGFARRIFGKRFRAQ